MQMSEKTYKWDSQPLESLFIHLRRGKTKKICKALANQGKLLTRPGQKEEEPSSEGRKRGRGHRKLDPSEMVSRKELVRQDIRSAERTGAQKLGVGPVRDPREQNSHGKKE